MKYLKVTRKFCFVPGEVSVKVPFKRNKDKTLLDAFIKLNQITPAGISFFAATLNWK